MIELCQSVQILSFDIIFKLGTHPLMSEGDIATMLGPQRLERLTALGTTLQQQTTLKPPAQRHITISPPPKEGDGTASTAGPIQTTTCPDKSKSG
jgi:hypothetical protein